MLPNKGLVSLADDDNSEEWEKIKSFVGSANKSAKHPLQMEQERIQRKKPQHLDEGGVAGMPDDFLKLVEPQGAGTLAPSLMQNTPLPPPPSPQQAPSMPMTPVTNPVQPSPVPAPSDMPYEDKASQIMGGITPQTLQQLAAKYVKPTVGQTAGMGLAGIGDAIASIGKREPHALDRAMENFQKTRELQMAVPEKAANIGKEQYGLSQQLQAKDPNSPYSRVIQNSVSPILKAIGWTDDQIRTLPAEAAQDAAKNGLGYAETQAKYGLEKATIQQIGAYQQRMLGNQIAEQEIQKQGQKLSHPIASFISNLEGNSSIPDGRVTVISPTGQIGHIPESQLNAAIKKGYKRQ